MPALGIGQDDAEELREAIGQDDIPSTKDKLGTKVAGWIGQMVGKAASGTLDLTASVASQVLTRAVSQYYGLG